MVALIAVAVAWTSTIATILTVVASVGLAAEVIAVLWAVVPDRVSEAKADRLREQMRLDLADEIEASRAEAARALPAPPLQLEAAPIRVPSWVGRETVIEGDRPA